MHRGESAEGEASEAAAATEPPDDTVGGQCVDCDMQFDNRAELTAHFKVRSECEHHMLHSGMYIVELFCKTNAPKAAHNALCMGT